MTKTEKINKHPGWRLSRSEKNWYYLGDSARLFCTSLINTYMTTFLIFQGVNMASLAGAILIVKIIDSVDDVLFGFIIDKIDITKGKLAVEYAGDSLAVILKHHGVITWGGDLQEALYAAVYLEEAAKTYVLAKAMGVQIPALPPELIAQEKAGWETYGQ